ncbi:hypothetical protein D3C72_509170 [compost metagenome]
MSWLERPACSSVMSSPAALISRGSKLMTVAGRLAPGWLPSWITLATPAARRGAMDLSNKPSSVLMTVVALLISPNQKKGSRGAAGAAAGVAPAAGAVWASAACALSDKTRAAPRVGRNCLMAFSL